MITNDGNIVEERQSRYRIAELLAKILRVLGWILIPIICVIAFDASDHLHPNPVYLLMAPVLVMVSHVSCTVFLAILHLADRFCHDPVAAHSGPLFPHR
jgi:hypothetical protein